MSFINNISDSESKKLWEKYITARRYSDASQTELRNELVEKYAHIVRSIAMKIYKKFPPNISFDDLMQSGFLGLMSAVESFDTNISENFIGYASLRIRGSIFDFVRKNDELTRNLRDISTKYTKAYDNLEKKLFRAPTESEIQDEMGLSDDEFREFLTLMPKFQTFSVNNDQSNGSEETFNLLETITDTNAEDQFLNACREEIILDSLKTLSLKERAIIALLYKENLRQNIIADILGLSEGRISQLRREIMHKLYDPAE